jgi:TolB-like protein
VEVTEIGKITPDDVTAARQAPPSVPDALDLRDGRRVSIAVLPHTTLAKMNFEPEQDAVQVATEMRLKLRQIPQVEVRSPVDVQRHARRLQNQNLTEAQFVQALAVRLRVDYVVWGDLRRDGNNLQLTSAVYSRQNGTKLADATQLAQADSVVPQGNMQVETTLVGAVANRLVLTTVSNNTGGSSAAIKASFRSFTQDPAAMKQLEIPIASKPAIRHNLLQGMETLEQALAYPVGDPQAQSMLDESAGMLSKVVAEEPRNALAQYLLSSCHYNLAQAAQHKNDSTAATEAMKLSGQALKRAYSFRNDANSESLQAEIEADYALLIKGEPNEAIGIYTKLAAGDTTRSVALRANWMLAGIYSGDWNVPQERVDTAKAHKYLIEIMAHWPDSPEADFIRKNLRWDEAQGTKYQYVPKGNTGLLTAMR